jgi:hypothetical protein
LTSKVDGIDRELAGERRRAVAVEAEAQRRERRRGDAGEGQCQGGALAAADDLERDHADEAEQEQVLGQHRREDGLADHGFAPGRREVVTSCR